MKDNRGGWLLGALVAIAIILTITVIVLARTETVTDSEARAIATPTPDGSLVVLSGILASEHSEYHQIILPWRYGRDRVQGEDGIWRAWVKLVVQITSRADRAINVGFGESVNAGFTLEPGETVSQVIPRATVFVDMAMNHMLLPLRVTGECQVEVRAMP